jgi:hypothetical protein
MGQQLLPLFYTAILLASLLYSKYALEKAGLRLQEKERNAANEMLKSALAMNVILTMVFFVSMPIAGKYLAQAYQWIAAIISGLFALLFVLINNRLYQQYQSEGFPNAFCNMFVQSRLVLLIGLLVFGQFLFKSAQTFANP